MRHCERARRYAEDVTSGRIDACKWTRLACQRHLNDLAASTREDFPYRFDPNRADRPARFIEKFPHVKGEWSAKRQDIRLEDWQCFAVCTIFGWVKKLDDTRRFRIAYLSVPRKNGKSILAGGIGNYMFLADGEAGPEIYSGATSEKQAFEVFRPAKQMLDRTPRIKDAAGVFCGAKGMSVQRTGARFEVVIGRPGDGASPSLGICDEYHEAATDDLVDTLLTGMGARKQPLLLIITTAGSNIAGPCRMFQSDIEKILDGVVPGDDTFGAIWGIDEGDDWTSEQALRKANPNFGVSVYGDFLLAQQSLAMRDARKQNVFLTKHMNVWVNASTAWMNMQKWAACDDAPPIKQMVGKRCVAAIDIASKIDIASRVLIFSDRIDGEDHYYLYGRHYLPEEKALDPEAQHYNKWVIDGHLIATDGNMLDFERFENETVTDIERYGITEIGFDPWNAAQMAQNIGKRTLSVPIEIRQGYMSLSAPMKSLEALVGAGKIHHDNNPCMNWMMSNVIAKADENDNIRPVKEHGQAQAKIDGPVAAIMAISRAMASTGGSVYDGRGVFILG